jgi:tetratricopeptide (TPR) repeat protein
LNTALRLDPKFIPAMVNLADLYRGQGRDADAEQWLEKAIALAPNSADAIHALGLLKVRQKQYPDGLALLGKAAGMQPGNVRYSYVYAVALNSSRQSAKAIAVLEQAHKRRPADRDALSALVAFERDAGNLQSAISYAEQLIQLDPNDPNAKALLTELRSRVR